MELEVKLTPAAHHDRVVSNADATSSGITLIASGSKGLSEGRSLAKSRALPVDDVDSGDQNEGNAEQDRRSILQILALGGTNVGEEGGGRNCQHTSKEVTSPSITTSGRGRVRTVSADHVVDGGHVNGIVGNTDNGSKDHGAHPVQRRAGRRPGETNETDGQARSSIQQEPETRFVLRALVVGLELSLLDVTLDGRDEYDPGKQVTDTNGAESKTDLDGIKVPLLVHESEGLDEHEDEGIGETRQERQDQDDGLSEEHLEGSHPCLEDLLDREALAEGDKLIGTPDVEAGVLLAPALRNAVHHDSGASLGNGEEVDELNDATEDELHPNSPPVARIG